jgi:para-aminobenzoate synthetase component 1
MHQSEDIRPASTKRERFFPSAADDVFREMNRLGADRVPFLFIVDFMMHKPIVVRFDEMETSDIYFDINGKKRLPSYFVANEIDGSGRSPVRSEQWRSPLSTIPVPFEHYGRAFSRIVLEERAGNSYLVNLTFPTEILTDLTLREIFVTAVAPYRLLVGNDFVVFSPEPFVRIERGLISAFPMKGTIDALVPGARDRLERDEKELAEHVTVVDLLRNDLNIVARGIRVDRFRFFTEIVTNGRRLFQTSSRITGELNDGYETRIGSVLRALLPAGSVTGAPKRKTIEIIRECEDDDRGYYTGVFGWSDGERLESAVMIRYIERRGGRMYYRSGGGVTVYSDHESEYREMCEKIYVPIG